MFGHIHSTKEKLYGLFNLHVQLDDTISGIFLSTLSDRIYDYLDDNPGAKVKDIENQFGTPLEISQSYISSLDTEELFKRISARQLFRRLFIIISISFILGLGFFSACTYKAYLHYKNTIITEITTETTIEE